MYERGKRNFYDEMKFNKLSKNNFEFAKFALESFLNTRSVSFASYSLDKAGEYFQREFGGNPWKAYEDITSRLLSSNIFENEILIVIADYITTPKDIKFEVNVKRKINTELARLAIAGVCRFDSRSNDLLQLVDLFIGAISYDLKLSTGLILQGDKYKRRFVEYFKENIGIGDKTFLELDKGFRNYMFNIFIDQDAKQRLPFASKNPSLPKKLMENEKEPSS